MVAAVAGAHLLVFALMRGPPAAPSQIADPYIVLELTRPSPPPRPPEPAPAETSGGGAPAAASRVHEPPPLPPPPEPARFTPAEAPEPELVVGAAETPSETPAQGQGGQGVGQGGGSGAGAGPGSGLERARPITTPTSRQLAALHPDGARSRRYGRASVTCRVRADTRLEACRVTSETPPGAGFGEAALEGAALYRFRPYMRGGRAESGEITLLLEFGLPR